MGRIDHTYYKVGGHQGKGFEKVACPERTTLLIYLKTQYLASTHLAQYLRI